jgi:hypothetical protein
MPAAQPNFIPADDFDFIEMSRLNETPLLPNAAALLVEDHDHCSQLDCW